MREKASEQIMSSAATASALPFGAKPQEKKKNSTAEVVAASMVGTAIEFYDNYCYSIAAASYFGLIFFTDVAKSNPVLATLLAFVTFAVSFLARPFGSLLFGHFGDQARTQENPGRSTYDDGHRNVCSRPFARV